MKRAVIVYHKNIDKIYPAHWIEKFKHSIENQTEKEFDIIEVDYGAGGNRIFKESIYYNIPFKTFVHCMNWLFDLCLEYDAVFNTNVDDYYSLDRIERQSIYIKQGYDIVSSNFALIENDKEIKSHRFNHLDIRHELIKNHNIIAHPVVAYSKNYISKYRYVPTDIPKEDLLLWKKTINTNKFIILPDYLLFHRLHTNSVCKSQNR